MKTANTEIYIDKYHKNKDGKCTVKIKITFNRIRKYYSTGISLTLKDYENTISGKRKTNEQKVIFNKLNYFLTKANKVIDKLDPFNFESFSEFYFDRRDSMNSVSFAFDKYIFELKAQKRLGTASSYQCARNSIQKFKNNLTFGEITPKFLKQYEEWMFKNDKSQTTIGIYLRSLKSIYNKQNLPPNIYPFGRGQNRYTIPSSKNRKKALSIEEIQKIFHYQAKPGSARERAKDYWLFLYTCGGMNVKDFCLLKWNNLNNDEINYQRAKTMRSSKESKIITIDLKKEALEIIKKWGQPPISKDSFVFPHLNDNMSEEKKRNKHQYLTKNINKHIKEIAKELGICENVTTYTARHSFATILKRSYVPTAMISELMGHTNITVTESYFAGYDKNQIKQATKALTAGFHKGGLNNITDLDGLKALMGL